MKRNYVPSSADLIFLAVAPITVLIGTVKLTQSDGDLAGHIRMGNTILATGHIPSHSLASYTAPFDHLVAHAWLSEILFALLYRAGGLPLLSVLTAIAIALTHGAIILFLRKKGVDPRWAFFAGLLSLALAATHWLTRPHLFSIIGTAVTLMLLESDRPRHEYLFAPLFAVWANLHGGWLYGLTMIGAYIAGDLAEALASSHERSDWLRRARVNATAFVLGLLATIANPYGLALHREVISAVTSTSLAKNIAEYLPPNFSEVIQVPFIIAILATVALFSMTVRRIRYPWLFLILISLFFALKSYRNIALFGVSAWPLIALHAARAWPERKRPFPLFKEFARLDPHSRTGIIIVPLGILMIGLGLNHGRVGSTQLIPDHFNNRKFPVEAVSRSRDARLPGRVFDAWGWAGYIMYAWPEAQLHVDPLKFNNVTMKSYTIIEDMRPGWQNELQRWQVKTIIVNTRSPMAKGLEMEPAWKVWYQDSTATVFRPAFDAALNPRAD